MTFSPKKKKAIKTGADEVKEPNSGRIHANAVGGENNFQEIHMREPGDKERRRHQRLRRVEPLNIYFIYLHTVQEGDSTVMDGNLQHKSTIYIYINTFDRLMQRRGKKAAA